MADKTKKLSGSEAATAARDEELAPQLWMMITTFSNSPGRGILFLLGAALCAVVALTAFGQIKLNAWNKPFYDFAAIKGNGPGALVDPHKSETQIRLARVAFGVECDQRAPDTPA
jgi:ABC-type uncharacterized transport system fused permease/ATPase subunit